MNARHISRAEALEMFPRRPAGAPAPVLGETSTFLVRVNEDVRDAVLAACQANPAYQRWVLACLQVRLSIQADQTFPHPPDRRAQVARIIRASVGAAGSTPTTGGFG